MVLTNEDKCLIQALRQEKKLSLGKILAEYPDRKWKKSTVADFLKKLKETGSIQRRVGSGRPKTIRNIENIEDVQTLILSQDITPGTSKSIREIQKQTNISRSSVQRIVSEELGIKTLKRNMTSKIYFCGSIRGGRQDAELYRRVIELLKGYGEVLTEHTVGQASSEGKMSDKEIHDKDMKDIKRSDYIVAEVTQPSLGVGYEIGRCIALGKRILCLYRNEQGKRLSAMIRGAEDGKNLKVVDYKESDLPSIFQDFFEH